MLLVLLQNAWSRWYTRIGRPGEETCMRDKVWHRDDWIDATWSCVSGVKLKKILKGVPDDLIWLDDTTLEISPKASGVCKPDLEHVRSVLKQRNITMVLACGKQALQAIDKVWSGPRVAIPHPAVRVLTWQVLDAYGSAVRDMIRDHGNYRTYRATLDTRGVATDATIHTELNFGHSWIRESLDQQAAGEPGDPAGNHPGVLSGPRAVGST